MRKLLYLLLFAILISCSNYLVTNRQSTSKTIAVDSTIISDSSVENWINKYKIGLDSLMEVVIGYNEVAMVKNDPEGNLGNFVCDLVLDFVNRDLKDSLNGYPCMVVMNNGGFRSFLPAGEIRVKDVFAVMPFDNTLTLLKISGKDLLNLAKQIVEKGGMPIAGLQIIANATTLRRALINGKEIAENQYYWVATSNYLANGGDNLTGLLNPIKRIDTPFLIRDIIIEHYKLLTSQNKTAFAKIDGRFMYE
ncbi:MAG TPA: 5'-nucleotidase [Bacteroidales bacterium]|jgi:2',3'-cyclic-nucleotide 2'-phosphodiesterase (5'-nucleotidase family)|nr:5'-nucleotidase C-terminal domain-containing protein [Bacteroidales bacterium]HOJ24993.1 5'-nucleotidase [Bacteroidales bacterium]HOV55779.1 5'-nucleotidase [Bacteroidales bacterium]HPX46240.1 5'-nucleotidase [Bacteroidales bacterium]HQC60215.1 5'-nucleotidase [Bacteroidales bacterium]